MVLVTDKDQIIAASGPVKKEIVTRRISHELEETINERTIVIAGREDKDYITIMNNEDEGEFTYQVIAPIISEGDVIGSVIILSKEAKVQFGDVETKLASTAATFLGSQMEQ